ncbi:MAG TPA: RNA polymerase sigma factor [Gemmatimonadaceae bacterium]|nr:RNA polymerase sigma factor [Gemmatimonadaceae bacterium]
MSDSTDAVLAAGGDYDAFERLYERYLSRIYSLCVRLSGSRTTGEELTQEVFVTAWDQLSQWSAQTPFGVWLHRLAIDVALNRETDDVGAERIEQTLDLSDAIDRLPRDARRSFVLHDVEGVRHEELAEVFGITVGRSRAQLNRARVLLLESLQR